jgi:transcriptional regulator with XRE-family HTH domain
MAQRYTGLRGWRERHGLKLEEVADLLGVSSSYLSRIERGERRLRALDQVRVARVLGERVGELFPASTGGA